MTGPACTCAAILAADPKRHFRGCARRELYEHPAAPSLESEIITTTRRMRELQKSYYAGDKRPQMLQLCKAAEVRVDQLLRKLDDPNGNLFPKGAA